MDSIEFYEAMQRRNIGTREIDGLVLMSENKGKWHMCEKSPTGSIRHCCQSSGPPNPEREYYHSNGNKQYPNRNNFESSTTLCTPREALEMDRVCGNCIYKMEPFFDMQRMVVTVSNSEQGDIEHFEEKRSKLLSE